MKKNKIKLVEMQVSTNQNNEIIEDVDMTATPDFEILDVTVIPDEEYMPTVQSILIDLEESNNLHESQSNKLSINILSETVNPKTNYSMSLFEFESPSSTITLSLTLTESEKYKGVFNVSAYTTKGEKVFETNTQTPAKAIKNYLNSLSSEYLVESSKTLKESIDMDFREVSADKGYGRDAVEACKTNKDDIVELIQISYNDFEPSYVYIKKKNDLYDLYDIENNKSWTDVTMDKVRQESDPYYGEDY